VKVLIAIDSMKGSISSLDAGHAIELGIREVMPEAEIVVLPLADGGEGTAEALVSATSGRFIMKQVTGPLEEEVDAVYGILGDGETAVIEVATACGLTLVPLERRNPSVTTSYGVGELIADAIDRGCRKFIIGLGGSATNDAGIGMLQALGFRFLDEHQEEAGVGGQALQKIRKIDSSGAIPELKQCTFTAACDVNNPLYGPDGAAFVFARQKGASPEMILELDKGLENFAEVVRMELNRDVQSIAGSGAAGGLGAAFAAFLHAYLRPGVDIVLETVRLEQAMKGADFVITGEGMLDEQTSMGKAPLGVARIARKHRIPVIALAGGVTRDTFKLHASGITACFPIVRKPMSLAEAMDPDVTSDHLRFTSSQLCRLIHALRTTVPKGNND
jgi:glycerate kinase